MRELFEFAKIAAFATAAAIGYGEAHDQLTAHICVEYFSLAHPPVIASDSPFGLMLNRTG